MNFRKAMAVAGICGVATMASSTGAPAASATTAAAEQAAAGSTSAAASLDCKTSVGNTSGWVSQRSDTQRGYALECTWDIEDVLVEMT